MDEDLPWDVKWNASFEKTLDRLKSGGKFDNYRKTVESIIQNPVRVGKYKEGSLKGLRTTHVEEKIICWEVNPGISNPDQQDRVEEVYFHFIEHHDDMATGVTNRNPVEKSTDFEVRLPYFGHYVVQSKISEIYDHTEEVEGLYVDDVSWEDEYVSVEGALPPACRDELEAVLPDPAEVEYDDPSLF